MSHGEFYQPGGSFFSYPIERRTNRGHDGSLGLLIKGLVNESGHGLYLIAANVAGSCEVCQTPTSYLVEETDHEGFTNFRTLGNHACVAYLCPNHIPDALKPNGD